MPAATAELSMALPLKAALSTLWFVYGPYCVQQALVSPRVGTRMQPSQSREVEGYSRAALVSTCGCACVGEGGRDLSNCFLQALMLESMTHK